jgi:hypothetical protein
MRKLHLAVGVVTLVVFAISGQVMGHHTPPMAALSDGVRLMFRSRHIYILAAGLVNLVLGVYLQRHSKGWRKGVQAAGSVLLVVSPALLISAFVVEPQLGFQEHMHWSVAGLFTLFLGSLAHFACGAPPQTKYSR